MGLKQTEASNQWPLYKPGSNRQNLSEWGMRLVDEPRRPLFEIEAKREAAEKAVLATSALVLGALAPDHA